MTAGRSWFIALLAGAVVAALAVWPGNIPVFWAVGIGVPVAAVTLLGARYAGPLDPLWSAVPDGAGPATELQAANLAGRLAEAADDQPRFVTRIQPRLHRLATAALRERGLSDMDSEAAKAFLGAELHSVLTSPRANLPPPDRLAAMLDRLERP
ncbi:hypothetical protein [Alloactinosynnema sp. L-07]|uniref:hypothetical protein n=1 Tax=Alloactinosynnema sp. L-07 TaxID=1653480 RepID=UPI00065F0052|nr:hypothetical protein [Alloactinosynnema sp. L-07]CRK61543.1 hypothetical protein [Alloactinosynnema sp. L-07]